VVYVYDRSGNHVGTADATYMTYVNGMRTDSYYYEINIGNAARNFAGKFPLSLSFVNPADSTYVHSTQSINFVERPVGGVIIGGGIIGGGATISVGTDGKVDPTTLKNALASGEATLQIMGDVAHLPASALTVGGTINIVAGDAAYELPASELNAEALAKQLGVKLEDLTITVTISKLAGTAAANAEAAVKAAGGNVISGIIEFKIEAVAGDKKVEVKNFSKFVKRTIKLTGTASNAVAVRITGDEVASVPSVVYSTEAAIYSKSNSVYAVANFDAKSFADLAGHWAKDEVEALASKLIVEGTGADKFEPKRAITRAEFAAMIVRALGLEANGSTDKFSDVSSSAWYAGVVAAAADAGIVQGDTAGTFRPNAVITRQELAAMVVRAMEVAGKEVELTAAEANQALSSYTDANKLGWAKAEVAAAVKAGIVEGQSATTLAPLANADRAAAATMVLRLLTNVGFIS